MLFCGVCELGMMRVEGFEMRLSWGLFGGVREMGTFQRGADY